MIEQPLDMFANHPTLFFGEFPYEFFHTVFPGMLEVWGYGYNGIIGIAWKSPLSREIPAISEQP